MRGLAPQNGKIGKFQTIIQIYYLHIPRSEQQLLQAIETSCDQSHNYLHQEYPNLALYIPLFPPSFPPTKKETSSFF